VLGSSLERNPLISGTPSCWQTACTARAQNNRKKTWRSDMNALRTVALGVLVLTAGACRLDASGLPMVSGNGIPGEETREVAYFDEISIAGGLEADVRVGSERSVHVRGDTNLLEVVRTEVRDGQLQVYADASILSGKVHLQITASALNAVEASGGSEVSVTGVHATDFAIVASGGSELEIDGAADDLHINASGGSEVHARELLSQRVNVIASGGSMLELHAREEIRVQASGGSMVRAYGRPLRVYKNLSGGSKLVCD
jgi:hypothetical protein